MMLHIFTHRFWRGTRIEEWWAATRVVSRRGRTRTRHDRAFDNPTSGRIAVKVINHLGDEVMKVFRV
ncbi:hypothetical protein HG15A2_23440 [Adhaeretor mobilis]|uniref:Uncharacterized protein n=1 Tax=Adhaeretor mobilis TaxID=1930276 RepID=A0A517MVZ7_9BACT|nr:hypothetical protein HG15A2_23440 [Adhaeretor mobilis]